MGLLNVIKVIFSFGSDNNDGSYRQDRYAVNKKTGAKEHTWSKTSTVSGEHKEGWHGENFDTKSSSEDKK